MTAHNRPRLAHVDVNIDFAFQSQALDRLLRLRANFVVARALVHNRGVVVRDVGDVGRLIDDGHVALGGNDRAFEPRRAKLFCFDEAILVRTDVVITVRPIVDAGSAIEARFRRQGGPTDVVTALAPGNPRRRPFIAGHPDPADIAQARPTSVVIRRPTKRLFRDPSPANVRVNPVAIGVWAPGARLRLARLPDVTVIGGLAPIAIPVELGVERVVRCGRGRPVLVCASCPLGARWATFALATFRQGVLFFRERLFTRVEFIFALREFLFLLRLMFGVEPLLHLTIDLSLTFRVSLLLLARRKDRQRDDEQQSKNLFHGKALDYKFAVIFEQRQSDFFCVESRLQPLCRSHRSR